MMRSWSEVQAMAERSALGAGVPFAQAARFGAAAARHLSENRKPDMIAEALNAPESITALSLEVERAVEAASSRGQPYLIALNPRELAASFLQALPCDAVFEPVKDGLKAMVLLSDPQRRPRQARLDVPDMLWQQMEALAAQTYVPESEASRAQGAGAGLMELD